MGLRVDAESRCGRNNASPHRLVNRIAHTFNSRGGGIEVQAGRIEKGVVTRVSFTNKIRPQLNRGAASIFSSGHHTDLQTRVVWH